MKTPADQQVDYRHPWPVRLWHWTNAAAIGVLLFTGLLIFDIHPHLYWGEAGTEGKGAFVSFSGDHFEDKVPHTELQIGSHHWDTTGRLGVLSDSGFGDQYLLIAPAPDDWQYGATRGWHFAFAWLLAFSLPSYALYLIISRRLSRTLLPTQGQLQGRHLARELWDHLRLHRARGEAARHYNTLQKITDLVVIFGLIPTMVFSGLAMSNTLNALWPALAECFGGHQSARSAHFMTAMLLLLFILVHVFQVFVAGFGNLMRSMITGRFVTEKEHAS